MCLGRPISYISAVAQKVNTALMDGVFHLFFVFIPTDGLNLNYTILLHQPPHNCIDGIYGTAVIQPL